MTLRVIFVLCLLSASLVSCGTGQRTDRQEGDPNLSRLTYNQGIRDLKKYHTSQSDVLKLLGNPNIITKNRDGLEIWTYTRRAYNPDQKTFGSGLRVEDPLLTGAEPNLNPSFDVIIEWTSQGLVNDFEVLKTEF
jgi:hypothetical protein